MQPVYTEYNIGHFRRSYSLSSKIDQDRISAQMENGVLTLVLPKAEEAKPRKIAVSWIQSAPARTASMYHQDGRRTGYGF